MAMALLAAGAASAQVEARPADGGAYNTVLEIGPIAGLTTIWHRSPLATAIPLGSEVDFRVKGPGAGEAHWSGATTVQQSSHRFLAHWRMDQVGEHVVSVELERNGSVVRESIRFDVIDVPASSITVSDIAFDYHEVDLGEDDRNAAALAYFFRNDSVADVEEVAPGRILTSTWRWLELSASVEPAAFAPLLEWRHDSGPLRVLGGVELRLFGPGVHRIEAGPAGQASALEVESYMVFVRDEAGGDTLDLAGVNRLVAETHPPGYEDRVVWTASSKHGTADPVHGVGPTFDVSFANANGPEGHWVGIKADYAERSLDGKGSPSAQLEIVFDSGFRDRRFLPVQRFIDSPIAHPLNPVEASGILAASLVDHIKSTIPLGSPAPPVLDLIQAGLQGIDDWTGRCVCCCPQDCPCQGVNDLIANLRVQTDLAAVVLDELQAGITIDGIREDAQETLEIDEFAVFDAAFSEIEELAQRYGASEISYADLVDQTMAIEQSLIAHPNLASDILLPVLAVSRYAEFGSISSCSPDALAGAAADAACYLAFAAGAAAGALLGSKAGLAGGPGGVAAGAVAGAVVGGLGAGAACVFFGGSS